MLISDLARTDVVTATDDTSVEELAHMMRDESVGSVVITENDEPVGIVTDRDLSVRVLAQAEGIDLSSPFSIEDIQAYRVMTHGPFTADVDDSLLDVVDKMCERSCRRVPVTEDGDLYGIVTLDDFLMLLTHELGELATVIRDEAPEFDESPLEAVDD